AFAPGRLRGLAEQRGEHPRPLAKPTNSPPGTVGAILRGLGQGGRGGQVAEGTGENERKIVTAESAEQRVLCAEYPSKAAGGVLPASEAPAGPAPPRRLVCAPGTMSLHAYADRRREAMFRCKTEGLVANSAGRRVPLKLVVAGAFVAGALGAFAITTAW